MPTNPDQSGVEVPGDAGAPDIVSPTGEEMPVASHDEIDDLPEDAPDAQPPDGTTPDAESTGARGERGRDHRTSPDGGDSPRTLL